jgi:hypothetical protein
MRSLALLVGGLLLLAPDARDPWNIWGARPLDDGG